MVGWLAAGGLPAAGADESLLESGEAHWIWAPTKNPSAAAAGHCYFRKTFEITNIDSGVVQITADDRYDLLVNGRYVGSGADWKTLKSYDIRRYLVNGRNAIAVRVQNTDQGSAGLVARVVVRKRGDTEIAYSTDSTWRVATQELPGWQRTLFNDSRWLAAQSLGELGSAPPWGDGVVSADGSPIRRFSHPPEFRVQRIISHQASGSLAAMAFNEWGEIVAAREGGPLLLMVDKNQDGLLDSVTVYCDKVKNCQGLLCLNGDVYAVGDGPDGTALYRLHDDDNNGTADTIKPLVKFSKGMSEHGPHAPRLGPDGLIYVVIGNHSAAERVATKGSPYHSYYEGDLVQPKYEDGGGHAVGVKAPGGTIIRTDADGTQVQLFAGGLRNAYDIAFNARGDLFTFDSDMEWDAGLPWYRPTRVNHVAAGAEFGWRSGWSKWPDYYLDGLGAVVDVGRGSPTGIEFYNHTKFPARYHGALLAADWSQGQILAIHVHPAGGSYKAETEVLLSGRPLNVTDLAVGPDGWLYFVTGGRNTEGGVYRVVYTGTLPPPPRLTGIAEAIRQPQLYSAYARQRIATVQARLGKQWDEQIVGVAENPANRAEDRARALDLMQLFGPFPTAQTLLAVAEDKSHELRLKAAWLMGIHLDDGCGARLIELLADPYPAVRRQACESLVAGGYTVDAEALVPLLGDPDRHVAWAARRAIETLPVEQWKSRVLAAEDVRVFLVGATGLLIARADRGTALAVLERGGRLLKGYLSDQDFLDLLRVLQLAMARGELKPEEVAGELRTQIAEEYPSANWQMNRELVRLVAWLDESSPLERMIEQLSGDIAAEEKLHLALHARFISRGWTGPQKLALLEFYESAHAFDGGHSLSGYLQNVSRDFFATFSDEQRKAVLAEGMRWPRSALGVLAGVPKELDQDTLEQLMGLDQQLAGSDEPSVRLLRTGIVAVLGRSQQEPAMAYLRLMFEREPERRGEIAMGLAQSPGGENWPLLVRSLNILEGVAAQEVLIQLANVDQVVEQPEPLRQAILCGLRLGESGGKHAVALLEKWTGHQAAGAEAAWDKALAAWQEWFARSYPDQPAVALPVDSASSRWTMQELVEFLDGDGGAQGDAWRGALVYEKAQCIKCHRFGGKGETIGPDLSAVGQRFQKKEIIESVLFPSQIISDQYASKTVVTTDGVTVTGIVGAAGDNAVVVLQSNGQKVAISRSRIEQIVPSKKSTMPEGLFNELSLEEIADLFAFLLSPVSTTAGRPGQGR